MAPPMRPATICGTPLNGARWVLDKKSIITLEEPTILMQCSAKCGKGIQTRTLFCGLSTPEGVKKVENEKCDQSRTFEIIKNCTGKEECDGEWFSGPWGEVSII